MHVSGGDDKQVPVDPDTRAMFNIITFTYHYFCSITRVIIDIVIWCSQPKKRCTQLVTRQGKGDLHVGSNNIVH